MAGPFDFLHIKGRTAGSSNELTFDVLDAASHDLEKKKRQSSRVSTLPKASQGSYHGVAGTSTLSSVPEVERRKRARRNHSVRIWLVSALAIVALVGTAGFFGYHHYQETLDFRGRFDMLIERFIALDEQIVEIDNLMDDPMNASRIPDERRLAETMPQITRELNALRAEAERMETWARSDSDKAALSSVEKAAQARLDLLGYANEAFDLSNRGVELSGRADEAWLSVIAADDEVRRANVLANNATSQSSTEEARDMTLSARDMLRAAGVEFDAIAADTPETVFEHERSYIDKRTEALDAAIDTYDALLSGNRALATSSNNLYNEADREAAAQAAELSDSPGSQVLEAFSARLREIESLYAGARASVATADSAIRSYL